ncbi:T9SS type A sorting domain-containing protein [Aquimarina sp. U1-2]|uniref:T9SS type A sorting domain-containing protein n=1 Tax=Aquimarina sp. U1-2 TaxID=2823141 RepID=UPI001AECAD04|nr:T9SS type A sorting domain-containing protein [Aquimarina sp. U1-2]MBP2833839.1 T9SS type A sorting domain-containing protein [Aquimarina sp. U1-2]
MKTILLWISCFATLTISALETNEYTLSSTQCDPVAIPDPNFEQALIDQNIDSDGVLNGQICRVDAQSIRILSVVNKNISSLIGIEAFTNLRELNCQINNLSNIDVRQNILLESFSCFKNNLSSINVTQNINLHSLQCGNNNLTSIDISANTKLFQFSCNDNRISVLDLSQNLELESIRCYRNLISSIDLNNHTKLSSLNCSYNQITNLQLPNNESLNSLICHNNRLTRLDLGNNPIGQLWCSDNPIKSLDVSNKLLGLELICGGPELEELNLDNTPNLGLLLKITESKLTELDLSNHPNLKEIFIANSPIRSVDISNTKVSNAIFRNNPNLHTLNLKNGIQIIDLDAVNVPELSCVDVDDTSYARAQVENQNWEVDYQIRFGGNCQSYRPGPVSNLSCLTYSFGSSSFLAMSWEYDSSLLNYIDKYEIEVTFSDGNIGYYESQKELSNLTIPYSANIQSWRVRPFNSRTSLGIWSENVVGSQCSQLPPFSNIENVPLRFSRHGDISRNKDEIKIYPSPIKRGEQLIIQSDLEISNLEVFSLSGKITYKSDDNVKFVDTNKLTKGPYIVKIETKSGGLISKMIVVE